MKSNFEQILKWCLAHEGGYVNHPKDPGGATNKGITQRVFDAYRTRKGQNVTSVKFITAEEVRDIYRAQYWARAQCDYLPSGLDYAVFDFAVNSGVSRASKYLQGVLGVDQDGDIGQMTLAAIEGKNTADLITQLCNDRMAFLKRLKTWSTFGRGWSRRVSDVRARSLEMAADGKPEDVTQEAGGDGTPKATGPVRTSASVMDTLKEAGATVPTVLTAGGTFMASVSEPPIAYFVGAAIVIMVAAMAYYLVRKGRA